MKLRFISLFIMFLVVSLPIAFAGSYTYDANGNLVTDGVEWREYNSFNQLVRVRDSNATGNVLEEYSWHPLEDRVAIKHVYVNGTWKETVYYITENFVQIKNATGTFNHTYVKQNGQLVAQLNPDGTKYFDHSDHLGSVSLITNESGAIVEETTYSPFGEILEGGETSLYDYEGKEFSSVTGDYDFNARRYDPALGMFLQPDPIIQNIYDPQTLNHYAFERNSPYIYTDPTGKEVAVGTIMLGIILAGLGTAATIISVTNYFDYSALIRLNDENVNPELETELREKRGAVASGEAVFKTIGKVVEEATVKNILSPVEFFSSVDESLGIYNVDSEKVREVNPDRLDTMCKNKFSDCYVFPTVAAQMYLENLVSSTFNKLSEITQGGGNGGSGNDGGSSYGGGGGYYSPPVGGSCTYSSVRKCTNNGRSCSWTTIVKCEL